MSLGDHVPHVVFGKIPGSPQPAGDRKKSACETLRRKEIGRATVVGGAVVESEVDGSTPRSGPGIALRRHCPFCDAPNLTRKGCRLDVIEECAATVRNDPMVGQYCNDCHSRPWREIYAKWSPSEDDDVTKQKNQRLHGPSHPTIPSFRPIARQVERRCARGGCSLLEGMITSGMRDQRAR